MPAGRKKALLSLILLAFISGFSFSIFFTRTVEEAEPPHAPRSPEEHYRDLKKEYPLEELKELILRNFPSELGRLHFCLYDFENRKSIQFQGDRQLYPASMIKTLFLLAALEDVQWGRLDLGQTFVLKREDKFAGSTRVAGTGRLQFEEIGTSYTLEELLWLMITESDNVAANIVLDAVGRDRINKLCQRFELESTVVYRKMYEIASERPPNASTACDLNRMLVALESGKILDREYRMKAIEMMFEADKSRIGREVVPGVLVANKTGTTTEILGDMAVIYFKERPPVALTVIVEDYSGLDETVRAIGKIINKTVDFAEQMGRRG